MQPSTTNVAKDRLLRLPDVESIIGLKRSTIYALIKEGRFPAPTRITAKASGWPESAVYQWVQDQIKKSNK